MRVALGVIFLFLFVVLPITFLWIFFAIVGIYLTITGFKEITANSRLSDSTKANMYKVFNGLMFITGIIFIILAINVVFGMFGLTLFVFYYPIITLWNIGLSGLEFIFGSSIIAIILMGLSIKDLVLLQRLGPGIGKILLGIICFLVFLVTLLVPIIPFIWTGAIVLGLYLLAGGIKDIRAARQVKKKTIRPRPLEWEEQHKTTED